MIGKYKMFLQKWLCNLLKWAKEHLPKWIEKMYKVNYVLDSHNQPQMKILVLSIYVIVLIFGVCMNQSIDFTHTYSYGSPEKGEHKIVIGFWLYFSLLIVITVIAYFSVRKFDAFRTDVISKAKEVGLKIQADSIEQSMLKWQHISYILSSPFAVILTNLFTENTVLEISEYVIFKIYLQLVTFLAANIVFMAYASLINLIWGIRKVYLAEFSSYVRLYPVATEIFNTYNGILASGLIRFWVVSISVITLMFLVIDFKISALAIFIILLVTLGFILFTFYPFYCTNRKINELKMQTIQCLVKGEQIQNGENGDYELQVNESILKIVERSPSQTSSNFQMVFGSSVMAIFTVLLQEVIKSLLK